MYGFWNRQVWMWVITIPAVIFGGLAVMGDSILIALRLWWVAGPILLAIAIPIWFSLGPAKSREQKAAGGPVERAKFDGPDFVARLVMTPILTLLALFAIALLFAFIIWLQPYWLIIGPVYGGFALLLIWAWAKDELAKRAATRAASPARSDHPAS